MGGSKENTGRAQVPLSQSTRDASATPCCNSDLGPPPSLDMLLNALHRGAFDKLPDVEAVLIAFDKEALAHEGRYCLGPKGYITFGPGDPGMTFSTEDAHGFSHVESVAEGGMAQAKGVCKGWQALQITYKTVVDAYERQFDDTVQVTGDLAWLKRQCKASDMDMTTPEGGSREKLLGMTGAVVETDRHDNTVRVSNGIGWVPVKALVGHETCEIEHTQKSPGDYYNEDIGDYCFTSFRYGQKGPGFAYRREPWPAGLPAPPDYLCHDHGQPATRDTLKAFSASGFDYEIHFNSRNELSQLRELVGSTILHRSDPIRDAYIDSCNLEYQTQAERGVDKPKEHHKMDILRAALSAFRLAPVPDSHVPLP